MISLKERKKLISLMQEELNKNEVLTKDKLCNWFIKKQDYNMHFCAEVQINELIQIAKEEGFKIKGYMNKREKIKTSECCTKEELEILLKNNTVNAIATIKGVDYKTIMKLINEYRLKVPKKSIPSRKEMEHLYNNYMIDEIASSLNMSVQKIYRILDSYNIKRKNKKKIRIA